MSALNFNPSCGQRPFQFEGRGLGSNQAIKEIYSKVVSGRAGENLTPSVCPSGDMHDCANLRGNLGECSCEPLDRIQHPERRAAYEDCTIAQAMEVLRSQDPKKFILRIGFFAPGQLHAEQVLLIRLTKYLQDKGYTNGIIELAFIDLCYSCSHDANASCSSAINQFEVEIKQMVPEGMEIRGRVFNSADQCVNAAYTSNFGLDLLHAQDFEQGAEDLAKIKVVYKISSVQVLAKADQGVGIYSLNNRGGLTLQTLFRQPLSHLNTQSRASRKRRAKSLAQTGSRIGGGAIVKRKRSLGEDIEAFFKDVYVISRDDPEYDRKVLRAIGVTVLGAVVIGGTIAGTVALSESANRGRLPRGMRI